MSQIKIEETRVLGWDETTEAYWLYQEIFEPMARQAANRHVMTEREFSEMCHDATIIKYLARHEDGRLVGMSVITNALESWPLISPEFFEARWPEHYERRAIWYIGFVGVLPNAPARTFRELIRAMYPQVRDSDGIFVQDFCSANVNRGLPMLTQATVGRLDDRTALEQVDAQGFWVGSFRSPQQGEIAPLEANQLGDGPVR